MSKVSKVLLSMAFLLGPLQFSYAQATDQATAVASCASTKTHVAVKVEGADAPPGKPLAFGQRFTVSIAVADSQTLSALNVWVGDKLQIRIDGPELRSFVSDGFATKLRFATTVPSSFAQPKLLDSGEFRLAVGQGQSTAVRFIASATVGGDVACGYALHQFPMGVIDTFAIVAGFNYADSGHELKYAQSDAEAVTRHLLTAVGIREQNIWLFSDDPAIQTKITAKVNFGIADSPYAIRTAFNTILARADQQSRLYVYFSGHMLMPEAITETFIKLKGPAFVLPNSREENVGTFLSRAEFMEGISGARFASVAIILDACYSGTATTSYAVASKEPRSGSKSWRRLPADNSGPLMKDPLIHGASIASSNGSSPSWELEQFKHGVFTHYLLNVLSAEKEVTLYKAYVEARKQIISLKPSGWDDPLGQTPTGNWDDEGEIIPWRSPQ